MLADGKNQPFEILVLPIFNRGLLLKERIWSHRSKFFPLRIDLCLEEFCCPGKLSKGHESCLPLRTW